MVTGGRLSQRIEGSSFPQESWSNEASSKVELLNSNGTWLCNLPDLPTIPFSISIGPVGRFQHSQTGTTVCGGTCMSGGICNNFESKFPGQREPSASCHEFTTNGEWVELPYDIGNRYEHSAWPSPSGIMILGSMSRQDGELTRNGGSNRVVILEENGQTSEPFELNRYPNSGVRSNCPIEDEDKFVVTGINSKYNHTRYNMDGSSVDLPYSQFPYSSHACGKFINRDGEMVTLGKLSKTKLHI